MDILAELQGNVLRLLGLAAFLVEAWAFFQALRYRPDAYLAAGKRTKQFWLIVTGLCMAVGFVVILQPLSIFGLLAVVGAGVFLADVRPALQSVMGRGGRQGPYGPW